MQVSENESIQIPELRVLAIQIPDPIPVLSFSQIQKPVYLTWNSLASFTAVAQKTESDNL